MSAPMFEMIFRLGVAVISTIAFGVLLRTWNNPREHMPARPLMHFMTVVVGLMAVWRWFILWVGLQVEFFGADQAQYNASIEPLVRSVSNGTLFLVVLSLTLLVYFHQKVIPSRRAQ